MRRVYFMPYDDWWPPFRLAKKSPYYHMFCTPNKVWAKGGASKKAKYGFEFRRYKIRGYVYAWQRMHKAKLGVINV